MLDTSLDLSRETERLKKIGVDFVFYDNCLEEYTGVVVRIDTPQYEENVRKLTEAGYSLKGKYRKKKGCELFVIKTELLRKLLTFS